MIGGINFDTFQKVFHMPRTVERCIEIVSEATRHIPKEMKALYSDVPWQQIAGIGNILRHDYDLVDDHITWDVATAHFPRLRAVAVEMLAKLSDDE